MESTTFQPNRRLLYLNGETGSFTSMTSSGSDVLYHPVSVTPYDTFTSGIDGQQYPDAVHHYAGNGVNGPQTPWSRYEDAEFPNNICHAAVWDKKQGCWYVVDNDENHDVRLFRCGEMLDTDVEVLATNFIDDNTHIVKDLLVLDVDANPSGTRRILVFRIAPRAYTGATSGEPYDTTLAWMPAEGGSLTTFDTILFPRLISSSGVQRQLLWSMDANRNDPDARVVDLYGMINCYFYTSNALTHFQQRVCAWVWSQVDQNFDVGIKTGASGHFIGPLQTATGSLGLPLTLYTRIGHLPGFDSGEGAISFVRQRFVAAVTVDSTQTGVRRTQHELIVPAGGSATSSSVVIRLPLGPHIVVDEDFNEVAPIIYGAQPWQDDEGRGIYISMEGDATDPDAGGTPMDGVGIFHYPPSAQSTDESTATANRKQVTGRQAIASSNEPRDYPLKLALGPGCY